LKTKNCAAAKIILSSYKEHNLPNSNEYGLESLRLQHSYCDHWYCLLK